MQVCDTSTREGTSGHDSTPAPVITTAFSGLPHLARVFAARSSPRKLATAFIWRAPSLGEKVGTDATDETVDMPSSTLRTAWSPVSASSAYKPVEQRCPAPTHAVHIRLMTKQWHRLLATALKTIASLVMR